MANINPRTLFTYVVPAFVAIVSYYWFKKKGCKRKPKQDPPKESDSIVGAVSSKVVVDSASQYENRAEPTGHLGNCLVVHKTQNSDDVLSTDHTTQSTHTMNMSPDVNHAPSATDLIDTHLTVSQESQAQSIKTTGADCKIISVSDNRSSCQLPVAGGGECKSFARKDAEAATVVAEEAIAEGDGTTTDTTLAMHDHPKSRTVATTKTVSPLATTDEHIVVIGDSAQQQSLPTSAKEPDTTDHGTNDLSTTTCEGSVSPPSVEECSEDDKRETDVSAAAAPSPPPRCQKDNDVLTLPGSETCQVQQQPAQVIETLATILNDLEVNDSDPSYNADLHSPTSTNNDVNVTSPTDKDNGRSSDRQYAGLNLPGQSDYSELQLHRLHTTVGDTNTSAYGSANHSPSEDMLESPVASNFSDIHSEGSSDSGKGGSDIHMPNLETTNTVSSSPNVQAYEFELPQELCGRLIGRHGQTVTYLKTRSHANIYVKRHPYNEQLKLCVVMGSQPDIESALHLIRRKFPLSKFPGVTLSQVNAHLTNGIPVPETLQLHLPEGIMCDVILSSLVNGGHFFVQQPTHPTYPSLSRLDQCMLTCYMQVGTPELPRPVEPGVICAAPMLGGWYRAQVAYIYEELDDCEIKFVDYGGYSRVAISSLRQIRSDFMTLPFQASECYLANVIPVDEEAGWTLEAYATFEELAQGQILQAQVVAYAEDSVPYIHLYRIQGATTTFINRELVTRGVALWVEH